MAPNEKVTMGSENDMKNAVIYTRVSSKEQVEGYSLDNQLRDCKRYAEHNGMSIIEVFVERGESAKTDKRSEFQRMLAYCYRNRKTLDVAIVWKVDRFARQANDHFAVRTLLAKDGIVLRSATEQINETPMGKLLEGTLAVYSEFDNDVRSMRSREGMLSSVAEGCWPFPAMYGYRNIKDHLDRPTLEPSEDAEKAKALLLEFKTGKYTQKDVVDLSIEIGVVSPQTGKPFSKQAICNMLRKPIYAGLIKSRMNDQPIKGLHPALISVEDHQEILDILEGRKRSVSAYARRKEDWPLRHSTMIHAECGHLVTGSAPKGRTKHHPSYRCNLCRARVLGKPVSEGRDKVHTLFREQLAEAQPSEGALRLYKEMVLRRWNNEHKEAMARRRQIDSEVARLEDLRAATVDKVVEDQITAKDGSDKITRIEADKNRLSGESKRLATDERNKEEIVNMAVAFMADTARFWIEATTETKQRFQKMVFPAGIPYDFGAGFGTTTLGLSYAVCAELEANMSKNNAMVGVPGFEPGTNRL
jgi:site-specific DNA recombinase